MIIWYLQVIAILFDVEKRREIQPRNVLRVSTVQIFVFKIKIGPPGLRNMGVKST